MKKQLKSLLLIALFAGMAAPAWSQATPSTEGRDFWVTFLRAADDDPTELKLTISSLEACDVTIENTQTGFNRQLRVGNNAAVELVMNQQDCYSSTSGTATYTALHVTATKDISLFAGNYRDKSFDATNVLPTPALLDDYLIQTYPPSDHEDKPQGSHFAIIAVEDGETIVDYNLTAQAGSESIGAHNVKLKKGQVWYVWTGKNNGDAADLSGTTVTARNGKKIAVFQGCPHTNIPNHVRDRDHIVSQAMPTAYWGTEFGITASRKHRRDIVAVMAINDGTEVYYNNEDGDKILIHTFDFSKDKKHYWTFEIGESLAYCADMSDGKPGSPYTGKLPEPLIIDSSCYLTTSCPAGVHLFMVSNRYDNVVEKVSSDTLVSDPAMLWISPIEQVIKEITFATYHTAQAKFHFMNIVTTTSDVANMQWNGTSIAQHFHPIMGNPDYSFARIEIPEGNHHLKGNIGFLAHVYGYGQRESYAYSCGSSTIQRGITFNGQSLQIDSIYPYHFCVGDTIDMKLNIGSNDYQSVVWDFGDGVSYASGSYMSNDEKKTARHAYNVPGWYDLNVSAEYINACTGGKYTEDMRVTFRVDRPDTIKHVDWVCVEEDYTGPESTEESVKYDCDSVVVTKHLVLRKSSYEYSHTANDQYTLNGVTYTNSQDVTWIIPNRAGCDSTITCHLTIIKCLDLQITNQPELQKTCAGETWDIPFSYDADGKAGDAKLIVVNGKTYPLSLSGAKKQDGRMVGTITLPITDLAPNNYVMKIQVEDVNCKETATSPDLNFTVRYPEDVFVYKFNNVLAVYQKGFGGNKGYDFVSYQWYHNDIEIPNATEPIYHTTEPFVKGDTYYVVLTDKNGMVLPSCPKTIETVDDYNKPNAAPAQKRLINKRIYIIRDGRTYDAYGQRVQ